MKKIANELKGTASLHLSRMIRNPITCLQHSTRAVVENVGSTIDAIKTTNIQIGGHRFAQRKLTLISFSGSR
jgi:hypothetical protein